MIHFLYITYIPKMRNILLFVFQTLLNNTKHISKSADYVPLIPWLGTGKFPLPPLPSFSTLSPLSPFFCLLLAPFVSLSLLSAYLSLLLTLL